MRNLIYLLILMAIFARLGTGIAYPWGVLIGFLVVVLLLNLAYWGGFPWGDDNVRVKKKN